MFPKQEILLRQLEHAQLTRAELVRRTQITGFGVQTALDALVGSAFVERYPQPGRPARYGLTASGLERLTLLRQLDHERSVAAAATEAEAAATRAEGRRRWAAARRPPRRRSPSTAAPTPAAFASPASSRPLNDAERSACSAALAQHFAAGRITEVDLDRRSYALYAAQTTADLAEVFAGLPAPALDATPSGSKPAPQDPARLLRTYGKAGALYAVLAVVIALTTHGSLLIWAVFLVVVIGNGIKAYRSWAKGEEPE
ncbi:DUF1707 domain-containing protein [Kribbella sp. NPDC055071]